MAFRIFPDVSKFQFIRFAPIAAAVSLAAVIGSFISLAVLGLNFGIDFRGGVTVEVGPATEQVFTDNDLTAVRNAAGRLDVGNVAAQAIGGVSGESDGIVVTVELERAASNDPEALRASELRQAEIAGLVQTALRETLGEGIKIRRVDVVGPAVSGELVRAGALALAMAVAMMLIYIWVRFEWQFGVGAVVALTHDVILTMGIFSILQLEFTLAIIAALLTIVGYSMNDTVIVFDRIRENLRKFKKMPLRSLIDLSVNETLSRTVMTSGTTALTLLALLIFGGSVLRGFSFAILWGIIVGTYSSIFIASPILLRTGVKREDGGSLAPAPSTGAA